METQAEPLRWYSRTASTSTLFDLELPVLILLFPCPHKPLPVMQLRSRAGSSAQRDVLHDLSDTVSYQLPGSPFIVFTQSVSTRAQQAHSCNHPQGQALSLLADETRASLTVCDGVASEGAGSGSCCATTPVRPSCGGCHGSRGSGVLGQVPQHRGCHHQPTAINHMPGASQSWSTTVSTAMANIGSHYALML
jgi:hypothetical protein